MVAVLRLTGMSPRPRCPSQKRYRRVNPGVENLESGAKPKEGLRRIAVRPEGRVSVPFSIATLLHDAPLRGP